MKAIPHFLVASALVIGSACSSSTETTGGTTGGSDTSTTNTDPATGSSAVTDNTGRGVATSGPGMGSANRTQPIGPNGATNPANIPGGVSGTASATAAGGVSADMTAFMGTFTTMQDTEFLLAAASSNMLEIQAGQLASQRSTNADVKKFAQMMVSHHTKASQDLKAVAAPLGVAMPTTLMPVHQALADRLNNKTGKDFDETYMDMMEAAHQMDIAMFEAKSKAAKAASVQSLANKTLPMLRSHHTMADEIEKKVD